MNVHKLILLISENPHWLERVIQMLEKSDYLVLIAHTGAEGLEMAQTNLPEMIICETSLPDMSGSDLCRLVRQERGLNSIPMVLVNRSETDVNSFSNGLQKQVNKDVTVSCHFKEANNNDFPSTGRKQTKNFLKISTRILSLRQHRLAELVQETSSLIKALNSEHNFNNLGKQNQNLSENLGQRIEVGMNIIDGLTNLLTEQSNSLMDLAQALELEDFDEMPGSLLNAVESHYQTESGQLLNKSHKL